jgi:hypothetical protein
MDVTSIFDGKTNIMYSSQGTVAKGTTHADVVFPLGSYQRHVLMLTGLGPDPVGAVTVAVKSKKGAGAAVPLPAGTLVWLASGAGDAAPQTTHTMAKLDNNGAYTIPASVTTGDSVNHKFTHSLLLDVPAILPDGTDQISVAVSNGGSADSAFDLRWVGEHPRY